MNPARCSRFSYHWALRPARHIAFSRVFVFVFVFAHLLTSFRALKMTHMMLLSALPTPSRSCNELSILCDFCIVDLDDQLGGMVWAAWALYSAPQEISSSPSGPLWYPWVLCSLWYSWPLCSRHIRPHDTLLFATGVPLENVHGSFTHPFSFRDTPAQTYIYA